MVLIKILSYFCRFLSLKRSLCSFSKENLSRIIHIVGHSFACTIGYWQFLERLFFPQNNRTYIAQLVALNNIQAEIPPFHINTCSFIDEPVSPPCSSYFTRSHCSFICLYSMSLMRYASTEGVQKQKINLLLMISEEHVLQCRVVI